MGETNTFNEEYDSDNYVVTYSSEDQSVLGWTISIVGLIDLNSDRASSNRFLELKHPVSVFNCYYDHVERSTIGFLPNGDLIQVSLSEHKIYKYYLTDKPKNTDPWKYSQIYDIDLPKVYMVKLIFIYVEQIRQYTLHGIYSWCDRVIMNKNQTLLAIRCSNSITYIYSMVNEMLISKYDSEYHGTVNSKKSMRFEFVTLKNNYEGLVIYDSAGYDYNSCDNKIQQKNFIDSGNVCVTNGLDENEFATIFKQGSNLNISHMFSYKIFNNKHLVIIHMKGIDIYTINTINNNVEHRYFWNNDEWNDNYEKFRKECGEIYDINFTNEHYKPLIKRILKNEFDDSKHSILIPFPKFNEHQIATKYDFINPDGTINNTTSIIQDPDSNTNLFNWFPTSLLAVYKLLTGDSGPLSSFTYREHSVMTILLVTFTFFTVIYLMNLFIGLLNLAIDDYNKEEEFLLQKAQIIMEIELFYMLQWQRNNKEWFPDWIYYEMPVTEIRKLINAIDNNQTVLIILYFRDVNLLKRFSLG
ncbi:hypothetical protein RclHR1_14910001 [Rhizophagus clarus]|uniref:Ion transport domain-containing protein n=1 Tax=Rhizophagus clarus TaxID=94130 RepID=A0A2Z6QDU5_9GLOM|nr:hypothetical protein RclHR1_14910001 [Rhizophagus clarus]